MCIPWFLGSTRNPKIRISWIVHSLARWVKDLLLAQDVHIHRPGPRCGFPLGGLGGENALGTGSWIRIHVGVPRTNGCWKIHEPSTTR